MAPTTSPRLSPVHGVLVGALSSGRVVREGGTGVGTGMRGDYNIEK